MASYNRVILLGNLTQMSSDPLSSQRHGGCDLGLAVNDRRKNPDGSGSGGNFRRYHAGSGPRKSPANTSARALPC